MTPTRQMPAGISRFGPAGRIIARLAHLFALFSGFVICGLALVTLYGILTRELAALAARFDLAMLSWIRPLSGDFELVGLGCGVAIAAALPWCQLVRGNIVVDLFTASCAPRTRERLTVAGDLMLAAIAILLAWRTAVGAIQVLRFGETTMVLGIPVIWGYLPMVAAFALLAPTALLTALEALARSREA